MPNLLTDWHRLVQTGRRAHQLALSRALKERDVQRTHFDGKTEPGLRAGEALIEAVTGEVVSLCGHAEKDVGSSIREVDQRALGKGG